MEFLYSVHSWANTTDFCLLMWTIPDINSRAVKRAYKILEYSEVFESKITIRVLRKG